MTYYLPSNSTMDDETGPAVLGATLMPPTDMADLKIFWGPEICRLEYLLHLIDTGRVKDDRRPRNG